MEQVFVEKKVSLVKNLILLEGTSRAGKLFLGKLISNLENTEYYIYSTVLEHVPPMVKVGGMTEDAAISFIKAHIDQSFYDRGMGRYLNLRYDDASSVYHSLELDEYLRRSLTPYGKDIKAKILKNAAIRSALFIIPDTFPVVGILFKAYPDLKMIKSIRHPIDLVYSLYVNGFGCRHNDDPMAFHMIMQGNKESIPWYAQGWQDEYESLSDADRVIKTTSHLFRMETEAYESFTEKQKQQILVIRYENLVEQTHDIIKQICTFLDKEPLKGIEAVLAKERVPIKLSAEEQRYKLATLKENSSKECYDIFMNIVDDYDKKKFNE
jgi:hypothetical protein